MNDYSSAVKDFLDSPAGKELQLAYDMQREAIINSGKKARLEGTERKVFAELVGHDKAVAIIMRMAEQKSDVVKVAEED